jgi:hypothetical protein
VRPSPRSPDPPVRFESPLRFETATRTVRGRGSVTGQRHAPHGSGYTRSNPVPRASTAPR